MKEIKVGLGTCGISAGGIPVFNTFKQEIEEKKINITLKETGCMGMCYKEVLVEVIDEDKNFLYSEVTSEKAKEIISKHIIDGNPIEDWIVKSENITEEDSFLNKQKRIVLRNCGVIDPGSIDEYIEHDGYKAIKKVINELSQEEVIN